MTDYVNVDWQAKLAGLAFAYGRPTAVGSVKARPEDFRVTELMSVTPSGEGEHYWLDISKIQQNTEQVAKALARFANVPYRDVGYSGLKDFFAVTRQWFSVWLPKVEVLDWDAFSMENVTVHQITKHSRKIKRGTHQANHFEIVINDLDCQENQLIECLEVIKQQGVPNYFGEQRFGRAAGNISQAFEMLVQGKRIKNRNLRSLLISSARSWLFNVVLSERVAAHSWQQLMPHEPANLNGSNSTFKSDSNADQDARLAKMDIHPTGPMWGEGQGRMMSDAPELSDFEAQVLLPYAELCKGLENARLEYQRRALRIAAQDLQWSLMGSQLTLKFSLPPGQFATSVLREIVVPA